MHCFLDVCSVTRTTFRAVATELVLNDRRTGYRVFWSHVIEDLTFFPIYFHAPFYNVPLIDWESIIPTTAMDQQNPRALLMLSPTFAVRFSHLGKATTTASWKRGCRVRIKSSWRGCELSICPPFECRERPIPRIISACGGWRIWPESERRVDCFAESQCQRAFSSFIRVALSGATRAMLSQLRNDRLCGYCDNRKARFSGSTGVWSFGRTWKSLEHGLLLVRCGCSMPFAHLTLVSCWV